MKAPNSNPTDTAEPQATTANPPAPRTITSFSLFEGDLLNRSFARIGLKSRRVSDIAGRCVLVMVITWLPMAVLAVSQHLFSTRIEGRNFFADYAAYAQFLIALPLFIVGERVVSRATREAAHYFVEGGIVSPNDFTVVDRFHREVERFRLSLVPEVVCIALAYALALATILPDLFVHSMETWHTGAGSDHTRTLFGLTGPGLWALLVALPILNYWWLRLAWKIIVWTRYLFRMSRLRLVLVASHPDQTGGIGFISEVQSQFALILFAYGISNVAAVIAYKVGIEGASFALPPVWGPALGFIVGGPALFTVPLLMFTKQLFRTKRRALATCRRQVLKRALAFEEQWLNDESGAGEESDSDLLVEMNSVATIFTRIEQMRVVPFDLKSASQLLASTIGSVATVLPLLRIEGPLKVWLEVLSSLLKRG
jgi:hypothetical protein